MLHELQRGGAVRGEHEQEAAGRARHLAALHPGLLQRRQAPQHGEGDHRADLGRQQARLHGGVALEHAPLRVSRVGEVEQHGAPRPAAAGGEGPGGQDPPARGLLLEEAPVGLEDLPLGEAGGPAGGVVHEREAEGGHLGRGATAGGARARREGEEQEREAVESHGVRRGAEVPVAPGLDPGLRSGGSSEGAAGRGLRSGAPLRGTSLLSPCPRSTHPRRPVAQIRWRWGMRGRSPRPGGSRGPPGSVPHPRAPRLSPVHRAAPAVATRDPVRDCRKPRRGRGRYLARRAAPTPVAARPPHGRCPASHCQPPP